ncbi:HNH endonuclease [Robbsia andropogonis]|uniref:HNH endonuclease n=1 Tax=Robbsia andropogonis TaxID=28092 RepID=UPI003D250446
MLIDRADFERFPDSYLVVANGYARMRKRISNVMMNVAVHRFVMGLESGDKRVVDHINGNKLDNRSANLRITDRSINALNRRTPYASNSTGFLGVSLDQRRVKNKYRAAIVIDQKHQSIGSFPTPEEAHAAYLAVKREIDPVPFLQESHE